MKNDETYSKNIQIVKIVRFLKYVEPSFNVTYAHRTLNKAVLKKIQACFLDNMRIEILFNGNWKSYTKNPGMQKLKNESAIDICQEEGVTQAVKFCFALLLAF